MNTRELLSHAALVLASLALAGAPGPAAAQIPDCDSGSDTTRSVDGSGLRTAPCETTRGETFESVDGSGLREAESLPETTGESVDGAGLRPAPAAPVAIEVEAAARRTVTAPESVDGSGLRSVRPAADEVPETPESVDGTGTRSSTQPDG